MRAAKNLGATFVAHPEDPEVEDVVFGGVAGED
jgi:hypothetical protein